MIAGPGGLAGNYRLAADGRVIPYDLDVEFFQDADAASEADGSRSALPGSADQEWSARVIALPDPDAPTDCRQCPGKFSGRPLIALKIIHGLRERDDDEYLYGRIVLPGQADVLRCKVWRGDDALYLRIYEKHHYSTHRLAPLP